MKLRKGARILLWSGGLLVAAVALLYLLRWPLFGGLVRSKAADLAAKELQADLEVGDFGGSLLWSIHARNVTLKPRPGSPIRAAGVERVDAEYGFLGSGEPTLVVDGARIVLAPKQGPAPPLHQTIRDVVSVLRSLRFPGTVTATRVELVLADGRSLKLERASLDHGTWKASLQAEGFGTVSGSATLRPDGALSFEGKATEGPIKTAILELGSGDRCPLRIIAELDGHSLTWLGTASFSQGKIDRIEGELLVKEGKAQTRVDFVAGRVEADVDAVLSIDEEFKGDLSIVARAEGPLSGEKEAWTLREGRVKTKGARFRAIPIDEGDIVFGAGSLSKIGFKGSARSGQDRVQAEGLLQWTGAKPDLEATIDVSAADLAAYEPVWKNPKDPFPIRCKDIHAEGKLLLRNGNISYDGSVAVGAGEIERALQWEKATFQGTLSPGRIDAREIVVTGSKFAASVTASGRLEGETLALQFSADKDQGRLEGSYSMKSGDFEGTLRLEGPMSWLDRGFAVRPPADILPLRVQGKVKREKEDTAVMLDVDGESGFSMALSATLRRKDDDWIVAVSPGTIRLPKRSIGYDAFVFSMTRGKASLGNLKLTCTQPELAARISGSADWDPKEVTVLFRMLDTSVHGVPIDPLFARVTIARATDDATVSFRWGKEDGDHFHLEGRWGKELNLTAELRAGDLKRPLVRSFLPSVELEGSISIDAHVTGSPEEPAVSGTLNLMNVSTAGLPPLKLVVPLQSSKNTLRFWSVAERTPYGALTIEGVVPLPGSDAPLDLSLRVATDDLTPLLDRLSRQARVWIPRGGLVAEVALRGPVLKPELTGRAEFVALRWKPPPPLGEALDLRVVARLDPDGIAFETVDGLLGQGPFWASGRWDAFRPGGGLSLWITARDALAVDDPLARLRVKPDVVLSWSGKGAVKLSGRVEIPLAIYHREFAAATPGSRIAARQVSPPRLRLVPGESGGFLIPGIEGLEGLDIDLQFATTGEFRIENSAVGILLSAEGQLTGTAAEPAISGVIRAKERRGEVKLAPGNFLRVDSGEVVLPEEIGRTPTVRFAGSVGAGEGMIQVFVEGALDNPNLVLKSDPPQPQRDLLAKLAFGLGMGAVSGETGVATLAVYFYSQTQDNWPSADRKETFFDKFRPTVIPGEATQQRRVPWELPPQGSLRSTALRTEYVVNSYFSVVAETNREGDVSGDLKLRIRF